MQFIRFGLITFTGALLPMFAASGVWRQGSHQTAPEAQASHREETVPNKQASSSNQRLTPDEILKRLPRRVTTKAGKPGDLVNFLLIGSKEKIQAALKAADWVEVDRTPEDAITHVISDTLGQNRRAYAEMPMSELYLFGRAQDYGYAEGIPIQIVSERHHFRLWKTPWLTPEGETVWAGAGTHDVGIERDSDDNLTHAIDPEVDKEREYIGQSLKDEDKVKKVLYLAPAGPIQQGVTATGAPFHSDGRILIIYLK